MYLQLTLKYLLQNLIFGYITYKMENKLKHLDLLFNKPAVVCKAPGNLTNRLIFYLNSHLKTKDEGFNYPNDMPFQNH